MNAPEILKLDIRDMVLKWVRDSGRSRSTNGFPFFRGGDKRFGCFRVGEMRGRKRGWRKCAQSKNERKVRGHRKKQASFSRIFNPP